MFSDRTNWNLQENRLSIALDEAKRSGKKIFDLTVSNPTECGFPLDSKSILNALHNPAALRYSPEPKGLLAAREAVASYYSELGAAISTEDTFITTGTSEAYSHVFRLLCNPGGEILVPAPSYPLLNFLADLHDVKIVRYPLIYDHGWQIDFHSLETAITSRSRALVVINPNNPTGHFVKRDEMQILTELCRDRGVAVIADEVFFDFAHAAVRHPTFAANHDVLTFTMSGLSKISGLPQMKAAWVVINGPDAQKQEAVEKLEVIADTYLSMNAPIQLALPVFLASRHDFQKQLMARVRTNLTELDRQLTEHKLCARLHIEGGWNAVLRIPATSSDEEQATRLLTQHGVYVHPGHFYDFASEGYLVIGLITPEADFAEGMKRLLGAI